MISPQTLQKHSETAVGACVGLLLGAILALSGCGANPLKAPAQTFLDTVGDEYLAYVEADPSLSPLQKDVRREHVAAFGRAVEAAP